MSKSFERAGLLFHIVEAAAKHGGAFANIQTMAALELRHMNDECGAELVKIREEEAKKALEAEAKAKAERNAKAKEAEAQDKANEEAQKAGLERAKNESKPAHDVRTVGQIDRDNAAAAASRPHLDPVPEGAIGAGENNGRRI